MQMKKINNLRERYSNNQYSYDISDDLRYTIRNGEKECSKQINK